MIDLRYVKKLIEMLDGSTVDSIEITSDKGMKIRLSKTPQQRGAMQVTAPMPLPTLVPAAMAVPSPRASSLEGAAEVGAETGGKEAPPGARLLEVKSPMVGT